MKLRIELMSSLSESVVCSLNCLGIRTKIIVAFLEVEF